MKFFEGYSKYTWYFSDDGEHITENVFLL